VKQTYADNLRTRRLAAGLSQAELACAAGLSSHATISNIERGMEPSETVARKIAGVLEPARDGAGLA